MADAIVHQVLDADSPVPSWMVSWTTDGDVWHELEFYTFEKAQKFARGLVEENGSNPAFIFCAERMMTVNTTSFLNAETAGDVELAPHLLKTAEAFA